LCAPRSCTGKDFTWDVAFTLSRTYFAALTVFHSFLALKERRIQTLTKTSDMARRSTRILSFLLQRGRNHKARRQVVIRRLFGFSCRARPPRAVSVLKNHKWNMVHTQAFASCCALSQESRLIESHLSIVSSPLTRVWPSRRAMNWGSRVSD
jgi:hypothetical protein